LTPIGLRAALRRLGLSQVEAAMLLGVPLSTLSQWLAEPGSAGSRRVPGWLPRMLAVLEAHPEAVETLRRLAAGRE
jgi:DNA-binding transcriptional regulator YiaG